MHRRSLIGALAAASLPLRAGAQSSAIPTTIALNLVAARAAHWNGRECLAVELTDAEHKQRLLQGIGGGNRPSFAIVHPGFTDGVLEVEIGAELTGKGTPDGRGFAGLSFHIGQDFQSHETIYQRMTNGGLNAPPPPSPRIDRAIQYVADPGFHFSESRARFPGRYEKGADIAIGRWNRLRLEISASRLRAKVDGVDALTVDDLRFSGRNGPVGLFVGDGSRGFFRNLRVEPA